jgi:hypothetical protein
MSSIRALNAGWMTDPAYRKAFDDLEEEVSLAAALIRARAAADLVDETPNVFRPLPPICG